MTASQAEHAQLIAQGAVAMLQQKGLEYWNRGDSASLAVSQVGMPDLALPARGLVRLAFDVVLRSILALILAIGLAFLRHYLDLTVHEPSEVEALGLEVVGTIPKDGLSRPQAARAPSSSRRLARGAHVAEER